MAMTTKRLFWAVMDCETRMIMECPLLLGTTSTSKLTYKKVNCIATRRFVAVARCDLRTARWVYPSSRHVIRENNRDRSVNKYIVELTDEYECWRCVNGATPGYVHNRPFIRYAMMSNLTDPLDMT